MVFAPLPMSAPDKSIGCWNTPLLTRYLAESTVTNGATRRVCDTAEQESESPKKRQRKSREQLTILNKLQLERFVGYSPRGEELARISQMTGLQPRQVTSWFSDQRRRLGSKQQGSSQAYQLPAPDKSAIAAALALAGAPAIMAKAERSSPTIESSPSCDLAAALVLSGFHVAAFGPAPDRQLS
jgi:hypothetical protein